MQEERDCGCESNRNCGMLNGLFGGCGCGNSDNTILFFIIVFLLLFTNFGCCNR